MFDRVLNILLHAKNLKPLFENQKTGKSRKLINFNNYRKNLLEKISTKYIKHKRNFKSKLCQCNIVC